MEKQTAVSWLIKELYEYEQQSGYSLTFAQMKPLLKQAKEMEKEQIKKAFLKNDNSISITDALENFEQYYNDYLKQQLNKQD